MFEQPADFRAECDALHAVLRPLKDEDFARAGQFKGWTINDVLGHLHMWNHAADLGLNAPAEFDAMSRRLAAAMRTKKPIRELEAEWRGGIGGHTLLEAWRSLYTAMAARFASADPKHRVKWLGPDMSVRSSITARQMETWAHGQAVYDLLGIHRIDADRIRNIAMLAVNTFGWCFSIRGLPIPEAPPHVRLTLPSGAQWNWFEASEDNFIEGSASEFCQVAAQVRNIADTRLKVHGPTAKHWMSIAQCFAGPPEPPPLPGSRFVSAV